jgi:FKBP-type peptidyl-prolyl cis-trans isomerase
MRSLLVSTTFGIALLVGAQTAAAAAEPKTEEEKALYALGVALSQSLASFSLTEAELSVVQSGIADGVKGKAGNIEPTSFMPKLREMQKVRIEAASKAALDKAAAEKGATKTASGLIITTIKEGKGPAPKATDTVKVHYHGTLPDGRVFDSSVERKQPASFALNQVIACWTEGVQLMKVGGKSKLVCPASIAYGDRGAGPQIPPGATLIFEVELLEIEKPSLPAPNAPAENPRSPH